ncbi:hypothetical protein H920_01093 [Fukomys damarensis]|uniref:Uncharacterized protein n=1 Tax=Fukomys damarensis TaxID=885580 RepID=A0A091DZD8_FUKDA|nr:hypothetical protein H920_01093 [Fukomys damarensis]
MCNEDTGACTSHPGILTQLGFDLTSEMHFIVVDINVQKSPASPVQKEKEPLGCSAGPSKGQGFSGSGISPERKQFAVWCVCAAAPARVPAKPKPPLQCDHYHTNVDFRLVEQHTRGLLGSPYGDRHTVTQLQDDSSLGGAV